MEDSMEHPDGNLTQAVIDLTNLDDTPPHSPVANDSGKDNDIHSHRYINVTGQLEANNEKARSFTDSQSSGDRTIGKTVSDSSVSDVGRHSTINEHSMECNTLCMPKLKYCGPSRSSSNETTRASATYHSGENGKVASSICNVPQSDDGSKHSLTDDRSLLWTTLPMPKLQYFGPLRTSSNNATCSSDIQHFPGTENCKANSTGRSNKEVREFLEKTYSEEGTTTEESAVKLAIKALLEMGGKLNLEISVLEKNKPLITLDAKTIENYVKTINQEKKEASDTK